MAREIQRRDRDFERGHVLAAQADQAPAGDAQALARRRFPVDAAFQHAAAEIQHALVGQHGAAVQREGFAVDRHCDALGVRHVQHEFVGARQAVGVFRIVDGLGVVEAVQVSAFQGGPGPWPSSGVPRMPM
jgi:hypothetical protein